LAADVDDDLGKALARQMAHALPQALNDVALATLAARLVPYLPQRTDSETGDRLLTTKEAAERARVHVETIRRAIRSGELAVAGRVGRSARLRAVEIDRWLAGGAEPGETIRLPTPRRRTAVRASDRHSLKAAFRTAGAEPG
jgi:excisionase family DNA binding protein